MLINILFGILAVFIFLFLFWKRLREDYAPNMIFATGFLILIGISLGILLSRKYSNEWWFWFSFFGSLVGLMVGVLRFKLRIFEIVEATTVGLMPFFALAS